MSGWAYLALGLFAWFLLAFLLAWWMGSATDRHGRPPAPEPPQDVRLVLVDGSELPVQTAFAGWTEQGIAVWHVVDAAPLIQDVASITVGVLPPRTGVELPLR